MRPPFHLTPAILSLVSEISLLLGRYEGIQAPTPQPKLRRQNRIRTVQGSVAIEGNTLDLDQVTAIFENKPVTGPRKDIVEVQNTIRLYDSIQEFSPTSEKNLLRAHRILMGSLTPDAGKFRSGAVGILKGSQVAHIAPPAKQVSRLMSELFKFMKTEKTLSPIVKACVFHYELEFIHPFSDGNGRMGRFWQSLILTHFHPVFEYVPTESLIKERQEDYYRVLEQSDKKGDSTLFIEFSLKTIRDALSNLISDLRPAPETPESRLRSAQEKFGKDEFTRRHYMLHLKRISTATASRDLALGVSEGILEKFGTKAVTRYRFKNPK